MQYITAKLEVTEFSLFSGESQHGRQYLIMAPLPGTNCWSDLSICSNIFVSSYNACGCFFGNLCLKDMRTMDITAGCFADASIKWPTGSHYLTLDCFMSWLSLKLSHAENIFFSHGNNCFVSTLSHSYCHLYLTDTLIAICWVEQSMNQCLLQNYDLPT